MRNIFAALLIFAGCGGWMSVATAQDVRLNVDWSQQRWNGFPDSVGKPTSEWKDRALHVHVVVLWNTSMVISEKNPRAFVHGNRLLLCYKLDPAPVNTSQSVSPGVAAPVLLEFEITEIPERNYSIKVSHRCPT